MLRHVNSEEDVKHGRVSPKHVGGSLVQIVLMVSRNLPTFFMPMEIDFSKSSYHVPVFTTE